MQQKEGTDMKKTIFAAIAVSTMLQPLVLSAADRENPQGWLLWHSYSEYSAMDSRLYLRTPQGKISEISGDFVHAMNGDFGSSPCDIVFMAIDSSADEWDIYRYNAINGQITNLTEKSGFRNEDPKFSPDGKKVVFKRGYWDNSRNDFTYNLAEMELSNGEITMLTDDTNEQSMPYYSENGKYIYYSEYINGISSIHRLNRESGKTEEIFAEKDVTAYYPVVHGEDLYFTKWNSADNGNDMIVKYNGDTVTTLPFNSADFNVSDACPVSADAMIYSSTQNGNYDLYCYNGSENFSFDFGNTEKHELGAAFYSSEELKSYAADLEKFLLGADAPDKNYDIDGDGVADCFDMINVRKLLSGE